MGEGAVVIQEVLADLEGAASGDPGAEKEGEDFCITE